MATIPPFPPAPFIALDPSQIRIEARRINRHILRTMTQWIGLIPSENAYATRIALHLKRCPLCDCINAVEASTCVCCAWHGTFDHDPRRVEAAFRQLVEQCPEVVSILPPKSRKAPWWTALRLKWRRFVLRSKRRRLDISA